MKRLVVVFCVVGSLVSCDLSTLLGLDPASQADTPLVIDQFFFETSKNPDLTKNYVGVIGDGEILIELPLSVITNNTPLEPTVVLDESLSYSPTGATPFGSDQIYTVSNEFGQSTAYVVKAAVEP